jgi:predicted Rossmann fold nucleotide-binding protein DprA/Smf involved in DNA uptake
MGTDNSPEIEELNALAGRPVFRYPSEPMPDGGYRITHRVDKQEYERKERERREKLKEEIGDPDIIRPVIPHASTLEEMKELRDKDTIPKSNENYSSLSGIEKEIVYCLEGGRKTIDAMSHLGIPVPKLLSVLTMLEIKQIVNQLPGGYFELKRRH